jgi:hypothetical protein
MLSRVVEARAKGFSVIAIIIKALIKAVNYY